MNLLKLETLKSLPARGYAYLFAKTDKSLAYVDADGLETNLLAGKPDPNLPVVASMGNGCLWHNSGYRHQRQNACECSTYGLDFLMSTTVELKLTLKDLASGGLKSFQQDL